MEAPTMAPAAAAKHNMAEDAEWQRVKTLVAPGITTMSQYREAVAVSSADAVLFLARVGKANPGKAIIESAHGHFFGGVMKDCGKFRTAKDGHIEFGGNFAVEPQRIDIEMQRLDAEMAEMLAAATTDQQRCVALAFYHARLISIHPFMDGNGRTGRAIMESQAKSLGLKYDNDAILKDKPAYIAAMNEARRTNNLGPLAKVVSKCVGVDFNHEKPLPSSFNIRGRLMMNYGDILPLAEERRMAATGAPMPLVQPIAQKAASPVAPKSVAPSAAQPKLDTAGTSLVDNLGMALNGDAKFAQTEIARAITCYFSNDYSLEPKTSQARVACCFGRQENGKPADARSVAAELDASYRAANIDQNKSSATADWVVSTLAASMTAPGVRGVLHQMDTKDQARYKDTLKCEHPAIEFAQTISVPPPGTPSFSEVRRAEMAKTKNFLSKAFGSDANAMAAFGIPPGNESGIAPVVANMLASRDKWQAQTKSEPGLLTNMDFLSGYMEKRLQPEGLKTYLSTMNPAMALWHEGRVAALSDSPARPIPSEGTPGIPPIPTAAQATPPAAEIAPSPVAKAAPPSAQPMVRALVAGGMEVD